MTDYIVIKGIDVDADLNDPEKGLQLTLKVKGIEVFRENEGKNQVKNSGKRRSTRYKWTNIRVEFAPFLVRPTSYYSGLDDWNDFGDLWKLEKLQTYAEIWIKSTDMFRADPDGNNLFSSLFPIAAEPTEISQSPVYENGVDELTMTYATRDYYDINGA